MAITGEILEQGSSTATVTSQSTGTITAGSGPGEAKPWKLICIDIWSATGQNVTGLTGLGLSWVRQPLFNDWVVSSSPSLRMTRWYAVGTTASPPTTGAISWGWGGPSADAAMWIVTQFDNVDTRHGASASGIFPSGSIAESFNDDNYDIVKSGGLSSSRNTALVQLGRNVADAPTMDGDFTPLGSETVTGPDGSLTVVYAHNQATCSVVSTLADRAWAIYEMVQAPEGASAGTSTASAAGSAIIESTGSAAGGSTASAGGVGASDGSSAGSSTADGFAGLESVGLSEGASTASAEGFTGLNADGLSAGVATANAVSQSTAVATGTSAGLGAGEALGIAASIGAGASDGVATADAVAISPSDGTSAGFALAGAEGCGPGAGLSAGTSTVDGVGLSEVRADGVADGTSTADGFALVNIAGVGTAAGVATVTGVSRPPSIGTANGVATVNAFALVTSVSVGNAAGVATVLGVSLTTVVDVAGVDVIAADMLELEFNQPLLINDAMRDLDTYTVFHDGAGYPVTIRDVIIPSGRTTSTVRLEVSPFTNGESYFVVVAKNVLRAPSGDILATDNAAEFIGRETKVDRIISNRPAFYDMAPRATIRCLFDAIGRQDDLIGGFRNDRIRGALDSLSVLPPTISMSFGFAAGSSTADAVGPPQTPFWVASGAGVSAVDVATSAAWPVGTLDGDIGLLIVSALPQNMWLDYPSIQLFQWLAEAENGTGQAQFLYWCRATQAIMDLNGGNMPNVVVAGSSLNTDFRVAQIHTFRGCHSTGFPWDNVATAVAASSTAFSLPSITTLGSNRLLVGIAGTSRDVDSTTEFTFAEGDVTEVGDFVASVGGGGGFGVATRQKPTSGTFNPSFTATAVGAGTQVNHAVALKPPGVEPTRQTPTPRLLTSGSFDPTAGASATTATITAGSGPTEFHTNEVCYCDVNIYSRSPIGSAITVTGCGVTWVQENEVTALIGTSGYLGRFRAIGTPTTGQLTITVVSGTATLFLWVVHQWAGIDTGAALQVNSTTTSTDNLNPQVIGTTAVLENAKNAAVVCTGKGTTTTSDIIIDPAFTLIGTAQETGTSDGIMRVFYALGNPRAYVNCGVVSTHSLISELKSAT